MDAVTHLAPTVGIVAACDFLAVARASFYRRLWCNLNVERDAVSLAL